jgi:[protein-PII] uridylyltransferase
VTLAALTIDVLGVAASPAAIHELLVELAVDDAAVIERTIDAARLLRAAASDVDGYDRAEMTQLAAHIGTLPALAAAHEVAVASTPDDDRRSRLGQVRDLLVEILAHPELLGPDATSLADARRRAALAMAADDASRRRLQDAPDGYVLAHEPDELARQARLVEPLPERGTVRVAVSPEGTPDHWIVDVACRDADGLLARLADELTASGCDIAAATVATWPDGAVVDTFLVRAAVRPAARRLATRIESTLDTPPTPEPIGPVDVQFDNDAAPWHTACTITGRDRPGMLAALAAAFEVAGVNVHSARLTSSGGQLVDRFALTDRLGRKLDERTMATVAGVLAGRPARRRARHPIRS